jgi:riboflavin synthase
VVAVFTGLVQDLGAVRSLEATGDGARLEIATRLAADIRAGDSVAVAGVCLTATGADGKGFGAEVMNQTLGMTALGSLEPGDQVNLELALRPADRLGGHILQGHVDATAEVLAMREDGFSRRLRASLEPELRRYVAARGSVALDGVSLTVADLGEDWLEVALVPETLERTTLGEAEPGRRLNLEVDVLARYVERSVSPLPEKEGKR